MLCSSLLENMKIITHYHGKGIVFILISVLYMSHSLGTQQNYSAYLMFAVGIILIAADYKFVAEDEEKKELVKFNNNKGVMRVEITDGDSNRTEGDVKIEVPPKKVSTNPYDIPDDF
jgi:hypothetical protein